MLVESGDFAAIEQAFSDPAARTELLMLDRETGAFKDFMLFEDHRDQIGEKCEQHGVSPQKFVVAMRTTAKRLYTSDLDYLDAKNRPQKSKEEYTDMFDEFIQLKQVFGEESPGVNISNNEARRVAVCFAIHFGDTSFLSKVGLGKISSAQLGEVAALGEQYTASTPEERRSITTQMKSILGFNIEQEAGETTKTTPADEIVSGFIAGFSDPDRALTMTTREVLASNVGNGNVIDETYIYRN
jgi:hypothetical protein